MTPAVQTKYYETYKKVLALKKGQGIIVKNQLELNAIRARCYRNGLIIIARRLPGEGIKIFVDRK